MILAAVGSAAALDVESRLRGSLGAEWAYRVGDEAVLADLDPVATETVRIVQSALELDASGPFGSFLVARAEQGIVHADALEAAEVQVGLREPGGWIQGWLGRDDIGVTLDRRREPEDQPFTVRPALSTLVLPQHAAGGAVDGGWPEHVSGAVGIAYESAASDAPYLWGRVLVHPMGAPPEDATAPVADARVEVGGSWLQRDSAALGPLRLGTVEGELFVGRVQAQGGWLHSESDHVRDEGWASLGGQFLTRPRWSLHAVARAERVWALRESEDHRDIGAIRLAWRDTDRFVTVFLESYLVRETGAEPTGDVVVIDTDIERRNDVHALGILLRWK